MPNSALGCEKVGEIERASIFVMCNQASGTFSPSFNMSEYGQLNAPVYVDCMLFLSRDTITHNMLQIR